MWVLYAILGAIAKALNSVIRKKLSKSNAGIYVLVSSFLISLILTLITLVLPEESLGSMKYAPLALVLSGLVQIVALRANLYAFKHEEMSYITPMFALTPLYAAVIGYLTLGERPSVTGWLGIGAVVFGVYIVTSKKGIGIIETFKHVAKNKGARVGMLIPLTFAVSGIFNKDALNNGVTPIASVVAISAVMGIGHIYVLFKSTSELKETMSKWRSSRLILLASIIGVASVGFAALALNDAYTSYVLSIRRLDVLITVIIGWKFMGDSNFARRLTGAMIMTVGVVLVSIG